MEQQRTATEVAEMANEIAVLRMELANTTSKLEATEAERDVYRLELAKARATAERELVRAAKMRTIIEQTSNSLINGIRHMNAGLAAEKEATRLMQEAELGVGDAEMPSFLAPRQQASGKSADAFDFPDVAQHPRDLDAHPAAFPDAPAAMAPKIGPRVRNDIHDARLPKIDFRENDMDHLRSLAGELGVA